MSEHFHVNTPLLESVSMSRQAGTTVYLKMENSQPAGSFKIRGIGHLCQQLATQSKGVVCSSGGNAGMAAAYVARKMSVPATIIVPSSTPQMVIEKLQDQGATVKIVGKTLVTPRCVAPAVLQCPTTTKNKVLTKSLFQSKVKSAAEDPVTSGSANSFWQVWDDANAEALRLAESEGLTYVPPFDHPLLWQGHASLISEVAASLGPGVKPGAVVVSVGGGGLLCGVVQGLKDVGWMDVPIVAMETVGADCLNAAVKAGTIVTLDDITSEAKCLGAKTVCKQAFEYSQRSEPTIISELVTDQQALQAIETFLDEERVLVELACGAALAAVYTGLIRRLQDEGRLPTLTGPLLVVVCGGSSIDMKQLANLKNKLRT